MAKRFTSHVTRYLRDYPLPPRPGVWSIAVQAIDTPMILLSLLGIFGLAGTLLALVIPVDPPQARWWVVAIGSICSGSLITLPIVYLMRWVFALRSGVLTSAEVLRVVPDQRSRGATVTWRLTGPQDRIGSYPIYESWGRHVDVGDHIDVLVHPRRFTVMMPIGINRSRRSASRSGS